MEMPICFTEKQLDMKQAIEDLESVMREAPQLEPLVTHVFSKGMYARTILMEKDTIWTGKIHCQDHIVIIAYGDCTVTDNNGTIRYTGAAQFAGKAGSKRALYIHEDTLWTAIHSTELKTVEECENALVCSNHDEYLLKSEALKCLIGI